MGAIDGKMCLVTGADRGIDRSIAIGFAREGDRVVVTAHSAAELEEVIGTIRSSGGEALAITATWRTPPRPVASSIKSEIPGVPFKSWSTTPE